MFRRPLLLVLPPFFNVLIHGASICDFLAASWLALMNSFPLGYPLGRCGQLGLQDPLGRKPSSC